MLSSLTNPTEALSPVEVSASVSPKCTTQGPRFAEGARVRTCRFTVSKIAIDAKMHYCSCNDDHDIYLCEQLANQHLKVLFI